MQPTGRDRRSRQGRILTRAHVLRQSDAPNRFHRLQDQRRGHARPNNKSGQRRQTLGFARRGDQFQYFRSQCRRCRLAVRRAAGGRVGEDFGHGDGADGRAVFLEQLDQLLPGRRLGDQLSVGRIEDVEFEVPQPTGQIDRSRDRCADNCTVPGAACLVRRNRGKSGPQGEQLGQTGIDLGFGRQQSFDLGQHHVWPRILHGADQLGRRLIDRGRIIATRSFGRPGWTWHCTRRSAAGRGHRACGLGAGSALVNASIVRGRSASNRANASSSAQTMPACAQGDQDEAVSNAVTDGRVPRGMERNLAWMTNRITRRQIMGAAAGG